MEFVVHVLWYMAGGIVIEAACGGLFGAICGVLS